MVEITNMVIGILLFTLVFVAFGIGIADVSQNYNTTLSDDINTSLTSFDSRFTEAQAISTDAYNVSSGAEATQNIDTGLNPVKTLAAVKNTLITSFDMIITMGGSISQILKIPPVFFATLVTIIVFLGTVILFRIIFRVNA